MHGVGLVLSMMVAAQAAAIFPTISTANGILLLEKVEKTKRGSAAKPRPRPSIRPGTDKTVRKTTVRAALFVPQ